MKFGFRVAAYTILEMTIAMLLAAIAIGITYTALSMVSSSYKRFDQNNKELAALVLVNRLLRSDIQRAALVSGSAEGVDIKDSTGTISYKFAEGYILRDQYQTGRDTFYVPNSNLRVFFENKEVTAEGLPLDQITFSGTLGSLPVPFVFHKHYSSTELIQLQDLTINP